MRVHHATRLKQSLALRDSHALLRNVYDPEPTYVPPSARERVGSLGDVAKDRWNGNVESAVKKIYSTDWRRVREEGEGWLGRAWDRVSKGVAGEGK